jgi:hypothetical protein
MITVCNYTTYQSKPEPGEPQVDRQRTASEPPAKPIEELKNSTISPSLSQTEKFKLPARYDTPEVRAWIPLWKKHWTRVRMGSVLGDDQLMIQLMEPARANWAPEKLCRAFEKSIAKEAKNILDPDEIHPAYAKPAGSKLKRFN